jgi:hypothetical protein
MSDVETVLRFRGALYTFWNFCGDVIEANRRWYVYQAVYDGTIEDARAQLDEPTFAAAWAAGRTMTNEHVVAYALEPPPAEYKKERARD